MADKQGKTSLSLGQTSFKIPFSNFKPSINQYILNKSENATLHLSIFYEKVLGKTYSLKLYNVAQISSKRFVETSPICLV